MNPLHPGSRPIVICGQGLAGTLLAWQLFSRGWDFILVDEDAAVTSSKIAAGIVTPITGQRLTVSQEVADFLPEALACYAETERGLGQVYFHRRRQVRLWQNAGEPARLAAKQGRPEFAAHLSPVREPTLVDLSKFHGSGEGFGMETGGWLDTKGWLAASAAWFEARGRLQRKKLDPAAVKPDRDGVILPDGSRAAAVVFCEGAAARTNPWFPWVSWKCAKGEILTISAPELADERRIVSRGGWLLPVDGAGTFRTGSTYVWNRLDETPTPEAMAVLEERLRGWLRVPWNVIGHEAAVRPIIHQSLARMGRHPVHPALVFFNGLGSKGVLHGPRYARMLAEHLVEGTPLPASVDVAGNV